MSNPIYLGGRLQGISPKQTLLNHKDGEATSTRTVLRRAWNTRYARDDGINGYKRVITPFRAVNNLGDFLSRKNYICGGPNAINKTRSFYQGHISAVMSRCDNTGVPASSCNSKFVSDSSDYITFKKQQAINRNYNDKTFGGYNNSAYTAIMAIRRF
jgi:hypothetical protein